MDKKYLFKIYEKCFVCDGTGRYTHIEANYTSGDNVGTSEERDCYRCDIPGKIEVKPSDKRFLKLYKEELKNRKIQYLATLKILKNNINRYLKLYEAIIEELNK